MWVPLGMYSLRMSFWMVPFRAGGGTPWLSPTAMYIASRIAAVELIVIEVDTVPRGILSKRTSISSIESIATPTFPPSPHAPGEGILPREPRVLQVIERFRVLRRVQSFDCFPGGALESLPPLGRLRDHRGKDLLLPPLPRRPDAGPLRRLFLPCRHPVPLFHQEQFRPRLDDLAFLHEDLLDLPGHGGLQLVLHLHRLDDDHPLVALHLFPLFDEELHHLPRHRRRDQRLPHPCLSSRP